MDDVIKNDLPVDEMKLAISYIASFNKERTCFFVLSLPSSILFEDSFSMPSPLI